MHRNPALWTLVLLLSGCLLCGQAAAQCTDDFNDCTINDVCDENGTCRGQPVADGTSCTNALSDCLINPTCFNGSCIRGDMAPDETPCRTLNSPCFSLGRCHLGFCLDSNPITCEEDGDPCTTEFCGVVSERCESFPNCPDFECSTGLCTPETGACTYTPTNEGQGCDDFDLCTIADRCQAGDCVGILVDTPTPTVTPNISRTPTLTPSVTPTRSATLIPPATSTPTLTTSASPSALPTDTPERACAGDCDESGDVTVDNIIVMVSIGLGTQPVSACVQGDTNADEAITVEEILQAVNSALRGC